MQRSKIMAALAALVVSGVGAFLLLGGASASSWHDYEGDLFAGHAYAIEVPAGASSLELALLGEADAAASFALYGTDGTRLGIYELTPALADVRIANPEAGRHVAYVYELTGALALRVDAEDAPERDIAQVPLVREDVDLGRFESQALDQLVTAELASEPVFVTLLYEGSAKGLDATVASRKGNVATIVDETASAFSPGVWTSLKGERSFEAANLDGTVYTVTARADRFEGSMVLSTLAIDFSEEETWTGPLPIAPFGGPAPREHEASHKHGNASAPADLGVGTFALPTRTASAFEASPGILRLVDPAFLGEEGRERGYSDVTIYGPDDAVVGVARLDRETPGADIELPVAGEYVAYVVSADDEGALLAELPDQALPALRALALEEETIEAFSSFGEPAQIELTRVPVALSAEMWGLGALSWVTIVNERDDVVLERSDVVTPAMSAGESVFPEHFRAGTHTVRVDGVYTGSVLVTSTYFMRHAEAPPEAAAEERAPDAPTPEEPQALPLALPRTGLALLAPLE